MEGLREVEAMLGAAEAGSIEPPAVSETLPLLWPESAAVTSAEKCEKERWPRCRDPLPGPLSGHFPSWSLPPPVKGD